METNHPLLKVTKDEYRRIYKELNVTECDIEKYMQDIWDWYKFQTHLPEQLPERSVLNCLLTANKFSTERVKSKIDSKCTLRNIFPEFFNFVDYIDSKRFDVAVNNIIWVPLKNLNKDLSRINILRVEGDVEDFVLQDFFRYTYTIGEYRLRLECCLSDRFIFDFAKLKLAHFTKLSPTLIKTSDLINKKAYGLRISGLHFINAPTYVDRFIMLLKQTLPQKLSSRIIVHENLDDLYEYVSREILPKEYGGDERSILEINDDWIKELKSEKARKLFIEEDKVRSDESKRQSPQDSEIMGMQGSFRKLEVD